MHIYCRHYLGFGALFLAVMCIIWLENSAKKQNECTLLCEFEHDEIGMKSLTFEEFSPPKQECAEYVRE